MWANRSLCYRNEAGLFPPPPPPNESCCPREWNLKSACMLKRDCQSPLWCSFFLSGLSRVPAFSAGLFPAVLVKEDFSYIRCQFCSLLNLYWLVLTCTNVSLSSGYIGVSQTVFRGTLGFHRTSLGVPREIVELIQNYFEVPQQNYKSTSKRHENFCPAVGNVGVIPVC